MSSNVEILIEATKLIKLKIFEVFVLKKILKRFQIFKTCETQNISWHASTLLRPKSNHIFGVNMWVLGEINIKHCYSI